MSSLKTVVRYGDFDFGSLPTPFVTRSENAILHGEKWGTSEVFTVRGQITGCTFEDLIKGKKDIISGFNRDFQNFEIGQQKIAEPINVLISKPNIKVNNINFPESRYVGILDYEIELEHFPEDYYTNFYGVNDPVDSWEFSEEDNGGLNISHNISCKGFNTSSGANNAFSNARNFVSSRTGISNMVVPHFVCKNTYPNFYPCLDSFSEKIDRIKGIYGITENYKSDLDGTGYGLAKYNFSISSGIDEFSTVTVNGNVEGCKGKDFDTVRDKYNSINLIGKVLSTYEEAVGADDLNLTPVFSGVNEDPLNNKLTFNITFNNDHSPTTVFDLTTNVNSGDSLITVSVNGNIQGKGDIKERYENIVNAYQNFNIFGAAENAYIDFFNGNPEYPLNPNFESSGVMKDKFTPSISFNASFNNKDIPPSGFNTFEKNISITPSIRSIKAIPVFDQDGEYDIIDLLSDRRAVLEINIDAEAGEISNDDAVNTLKLEGSYLLQKYGRVEKFKLENYSIETGNSKNYSLQATWSFETPYKLIAPPNYSGVNELRIK